MLKIFCMRCGSETQYTATKPLFCSGCGESFDKSVSRAKITSPLKPRIIKTVDSSPIKGDDGDDSNDYDENDEFHGEIPSLESLACDNDEIVGKSLKQTRSTFGGLVESAIPQNPKDLKQLKKTYKNSIKEYSKRKGEKVDFKAFAEQMKRDCASSRPAK